MGSFWGDILHGVRAEYRADIDEELAWIQDKDILNAASAMIEAKVKKEKITELLVKYWNLRPSEAEDFIQEAENRLKK